jgi:hypothetical protein
MLNRGKYFKANKRDDVKDLRYQTRSYFNDLIFDEKEHRYFLNRKDKRELKSVSKVIEGFAMHFDSDTKAQECFEKYYDKEDSKYYQMTKEMILESWKNINKKACDFGTEKHSFNEDVFYLLAQQYDNIQRKLVNGNLIPEDTTDEYSINFWNDLPECYIPILTETKVYNEKLGYAGTFDLLIAYDDGKKPLFHNIMILDFKTNKDLFKNFNEQKMLPPFDDMLDMPYSHYILQLNLYQLALEQIGCKVVDRRLIYINGKTNYEMYRLPDITDKINNNEKFFNI